MITFRVEELIADESGLWSWAARFAPLLAQGGVVLLKGPLGAGKTTAVKALVRSLGVRADVTSPTFDLLHVYDAPGLVIFHLDGYRISDPREWDVLDLPPPGDPGALILAEWGDDLRVQYPERVEISLEMVVSRPEARRLVMTGLGQVFAPRLEAWQKEGAEHGI
ncbi:MAG: tRNA (adenosine(37)-N6)-threonylcarbamoyltransferase complex ATPase subunit type 1 TsaE [Firmicutes bacterium]|nr:tRNA (adenosine(37)-N6)-threonylcarbamoyltransferase complex ATPase subunit type 1 TsaE [Bacillota bacterium]